MILNRMTKDEGKLRVLREWEHGTAVEISARTWSGASGCRNGVCVPFCEKVEVAAFQRRFRQEVRE